MSVACTDTKFYKEYANRVDSLKATLEASASSFERLDTARIANLRSQVYSNLDTLTKLEPEHVMTAVNEYRYVGKSCKTISMEFPLVEEELQYSRIQLQALYHDIRHRHLEPEKVKLYFNQEQEAIGMVKRRMEVLVNLSEQQLQNFELLNPKVESIIDSLSKTD
jgi:hypothetical protein